MPSTMDRKRGKRDHRVRTKKKVTVTMIQPRPDSQSSQQAKESRAKELMKLFDPRWSRKVIGMFWRPARKDRADRHVNSYVTTLLDCGHLVDMSIGRAVEVMTKGIGEFCHLCHDDLVAQERPSCPPECPRCDDSQDLDKWLDEKIPWRQKTRRQK